MAGLLEQELASSGFERQGELLVRENQGVIVEVDPKAGTITARIEADQQVQLEREGEASVYDFGSELTKNVKEAKREELRQQMEKEARSRRAKTAKRTHRPPGSGVGRPAGGVGPGRQPRDRGSPQTKSRPNRPDQGTDRRPGKRLLDDRAGSLVLRHRQFFSQDARAIGVDCDRRKNYDNHI